MHEVPDPEAVTSQGNLNGDHDGMDEQKQVKVVVPEALVWQPALETMLRMYALPRLGLAELTAMRLSCRWVPPSVLPSHACICTPFSSQGLTDIIWFMRGSIVSLINMSSLDNTKK